MISKAPSIHRENFLRLLNDELQAIGEDNEVSPKEAYARLVLATLDYEFIKEQYSDGSREFGIDYWDSSEETSVIFQFKSTDFSKGIDESRKVIPIHLTDLPRIRNILKSIDGEPIKANTSVSEFINRLRHNMRRYYDSPVKHDEPYGISIYLAVLASSFTSQAQDEFERNCEELMLYLKLGQIKFSYIPILIDDLINEKWRSTNTEWRDCNGQKRNFIDLAVCKKSMIDEPKSCVFFTRAMDLFESYQRFGYQIFEPNVRCAIPRSNVNKEIMASVKSQHGRKDFCHLNNGITMICAGFKKPRGMGQKFRVTEPGIINGLQTIKSIADAYKELDPAGKTDFEQNCSVMVRLHTRNSVKDYRELVKSTNNQNPMQPRNLHSNDPEQIAFERLFAELNWFYERKQGAWPAFKSNPRLWKSLARKKVSDFQIGSGRFRTVDNEDLSQCWLAFLGFSEEAVHNRKEIFEKDEMYEFIFTSRPMVHGADLDFEFRPREMESNLVRGSSPPPDLMLASWFLRESVRKLVPTAMANRDEACARLKIGEKTREEQDIALAKDTEYLRNVILRAWSYLFPEFVGLVLFRAFGEQVYYKGKKLLLNRSLAAINKERDFEGVIEKIRTEQYENDDFLVVMWNLFVYCADRLVNSPWLESWKQARNRTRFNYSAETRKRLKQELEEADRYLSKDQITRTWAVGLNRSKGVFSFAREVLKP
ncbi:MAG: hypothetical protein FJ134_08445 [Deltaproteobacteria bacterium]|nr:hypothetical protein [Deltaproteobacteria bacterium]